MLGRIETVAESSERFATWVNAGTIVADSGVTVAPETEGIALIKESFSESVKVILP